LFADGLLGASVCAERFGVGIREVTWGLGVLDDGVADHTRGISRIETGGIGEVEIRATEKLLVSSSVSASLLFPDHIRSIKTSGVSYLS
jgi:hypothetical protein